MSNMSDFIKPPKSHLMTYRIARGEQGVLTYEPYKSYLLPHWRFRSVLIARTSSSTLHQKFLEFYDQRDFVGMDMTRKFIQMGMTRAKRYANYKGGRKYVTGKENGERIEKSKGHEGRKEKLEASEIFREVWEMCREHKGYGELKKKFLKEQKEWNDMQSYTAISEVEEEKGGKDSKRPAKLETQEVKELEAKKQQTKRIKRESH